MTGKKRLDRRTSPVIPLIFPGSIRPGIILPDPSHGLTGQRHCFWKNAPIVNETSVWETHVRGMG